MSRVKPSASGRDNMRDDVSMTKLWHGVIDDLRLLPSIPGTSKTHPEDDLTSPNSVIIEKAHLDDALKKLKALIELHRVDQPSQASEPIPRDRASTPVSAATAILGGVNKRKRGHEISPSPVPAPSPSRGLVGEVNSPMLGRGGTPTSAAGGGFGRVKKEGNGVKEYTGPFADQLPLQPGRKVVYRTSDSTGDLWCLCQVNKVLGDKFKYEIQDADETGTIYITTLKSITPLPAPSLPTTSSSHPNNLEDFPMGSQVLGLYPDTTSFYQATVKSAPVPGTGHGLGVKGGNGRADPRAVVGKYRLNFVDDGDNIHEVYKDSVIRMP